MREENRSDRSCQVLKGWEAEAPEKLSQSANFESHAALNPALRNSKLEKLSENLSEKL